MTSDIFLFENKCTMIISIILMFNTNNFNLLCVISKDIKYKKTSLL